VNAVLKPAPAAARRPMSAADLPAVLALELAVYPFPWSHGNFVDSLAAGHPAHVLRDGAGQLTGYSVAMLGVQEMHLLNLTIAPACRRLGLARGLLDALVAQCRAERRTQLWLEVRQSNARAREVYARYGFQTTGTRRAYYPAAEGREDAVVMRLAIVDAPAGANDALD
jgi:[ribosomal protein S18]-alanine N-acetyltransferase